CANYYDTSLYWFFDVW
nr:immunoglobulin heavy chain junction region [Mus musculus]